jgi:hypothetical protein
VSGWVELRGFEPLTSSMPSTIRSGYLLATRRANRAWTFAQTPG